ncbi:MAG: hypothetical protein M3R08_04440 [Bacteroidota bacterium]|nr:hypothetical protein [Bacteroidota bacterium]
MVSLLRTIRVSPDGKLYNASRVHYPSLAFAAMLVGLLISLSRLSGGVGLSPDPTIYIVGAQHLIEHGEWTHRVNWPSKSMDPEYEPYSDHAPGYAAYLVPFILVLEDLYTAATVAHGFAVSLSFLSLYFLLQVLRFGFLYQLFIYFSFTCLDTFALIQSYYVTEPLFIAFSFLGASFTLLSITDHGNRWHWLVVGASFLIASTIKHIGVFNMAWIILPILIRGRSRLPHFILIGMCCIGPVAGWLIWNKFIHGTVSFSHKIGETNFTDDLLRPIFFFGQEFFSISSRSWPGFFLMILIGLTILSPLYFHKTFLRELKAGRLTIELQMHLILVLAFVSHFLGIWTLSLFTHFSWLDDRLLAPSIAIGLVATFSALNLLAGFVRSQYASSLVLVPVLLFFTVSDRLDLPHLPPDNLHIQDPPEKELWRTLAEMGISTEATHFYSDYCFSHHVFSNIPQRIIWNEEDYAVEQIRSLMNKGSRPFFVFKAEADERVAFEQSWYKANAKAQEPFLTNGYAVYHQLIR